MTNYIKDSKNDVNYTQCICDSLEYALREGNGTPLQYSCLENPMDGGAW